MNDDKLAGSFPVIQRSMSISCLISLAVSQALGGMVGHVEISSSEGRGGWK